MSLSGCLGEGKRFSKWMGYGVVLLTKFDWVPLVRFELWWFDKVVVYFQTHQNIVGLYCSQQSVSSPRGTIFL